MHKRSLMGEVRPWFGNPLICSADGGGDPGGGGGDDKKFTQDDVNALLAKERKAHEKKFGDYSELKEKAGKVDELTERIAALEEEKELAGKTAKEQEEARAAKERKTLTEKAAKAEGERDEAVANLTKETDAHRMTRVRHELSMSLSEAKVHAPAAQDALDALIRDSELEFDDDGAFKGITLALDGIRYDDPKKAAAAYLESKPHFASGTPGGTGTKQPTGGKPTNKPLFEMTSEERLQLAADQRAQ